MSFQAYLDKVKAQTGKTPEDFRPLAAAKGLTKAGEIVAWLKAEYGLGHGHANAVVHVLLNSADRETSQEDQVAAHFSGGKAAWRPTYDAVIAALASFGPDTGVAPTKTYISLLRGSKKIGIAQIAAERFDLGIKLKGTAPTERLEAAGSWNAMVTHRVRMSAPEQLDAEAIDWLRQAYAQAG